ncbi:hypothetical protein [Desulfosporosinus nitroreducens]|uniref:Uncharacterized protein n=1 Tax=Desulfosporosinus nitroreducens TaxID=2018668 RepID=A0ABT8QS63_9FIRM|nr:hypothetical protein [Desulfosporosinus nitroreducens]MDO0824135.1 hypothetical protein [Desulfosporosinus nitroreducens]
MNAVGRVANPRDGKANGGFTMITPVNVLKAVIAVAVNDVSPAGGLI